MIDNYLSCILVTFITVYFMSTYGIKKLLGSTIYIARQFPVVAAQITKEQKKIKKKLENEMKLAIQRKSITRIPEEGLDNQVIIGEMEQLRNFEIEKWGKWKSFRDSLSW